MTPWTAACQASLSITNSRSSLKLVSIELVMPSSHLILCPPLLFSPSVFPSIRIFSNESTLCMRWPKYWSFSFSISPSNEYSGLISWLISICLSQYMHAWLLSHSVVLTLCNPMDCSPPGSSAHGIPRQEYWSGLSFPSPGNLPNLKNSCCASRLLEISYFPIDWFDKYSLVLSTVPQTLSGK